MNFRKIVVGLIFICGAFSIYAKDYSVPANKGLAVGLRMGVPFGVTGKFIANDRLTYEGILSSGWGGIGLTGLVEIYNPTSLDDNLTWYYGAGAHVAFGNNKETSFYDKGTNGVIGVDGVIGLNYELEDYPVEISLDWMPSLNLIGEFGYGNHFFSLSARYLFK